MCLDLGRYTLTMLLWLLLVSLLLAPASLLPAPASLLPVLAPLLLVLVSSASPGKGMHPRSRCTFPCDCDRKT